MSRAGVKLNQASKNFAVRSRGCSLFLSLPAEFAITIHCQDSQRKVREWVCVCVPGFTSSHPNRDHTLDWAWLRIGLQGPSSWEWDREYCKREMQNCLEPLSNLEPLRLPRPLWELHQYQPNPKQNFKTFQWNKRAWAAKNRMGGYGRIFIMCFELVWLRILWSGQGLNLVGGRLASVAACSWEWIHRSLPCLRENDTFHEENYADIFTCSQRQMPSRSSCKAHASKWELLWSPTMSPNFLFSLWSLEWTSAL